LLEAALKHRVVLAHGACRRAGRVGPARASGRGSCGCQIYSVTSCDLRILMDQPTESISSRDCPNRPSHQGGGLAGSKWRSLPQGAVRAVAVAMINVLANNTLQLPTSKDQHPVQHLTPNRADPPLRVGVRLGRPHRRAQHPDPFSDEDRVERGGELRVPIAEQEPKRPRRPASSMSRLRACCVTHSPTGCAVTPSTWTRRVATSITNRTCSRFGNTVSTVKKSTASTPLAWARRNCRHDTADRVGAGATPARWRMVHTVLARSCSPGGTARRGRGGSPRSGSPWPAAAPKRGARPPWPDGHADGDRSTGAGPAPDATAAA